MSLFNKKDDKMPEPADKKKGYRKWIALAILATGMSVAAIIAAKELYDSFFKRCERPDYSVTPGMYCYERYGSSLPRREMYFYSGKAKLKGYYYEVPGSKGLIVLVHGLRLGSDDYLPITEFFVQNGYSVFTYDGTGTYDSEGKSTVGMCQSLVDLDNALNFVKGEKELSKKNLYLVGHSCGGYAVTSVLSLHPEVKACAAIAAVNNCYTLILDKGKQYGGKLAAEGIPKAFLDTYQKYLFGDYIHCNGVKGINDSGIPVLVAHGNKDEVISYDQQSVICNKKDITNPNVIYYVGKGALSGHSTIWHSEEAVAYQQEVKKHLKSLSDKAEKQAYVATVDHRLYSEINEELFDKILTMFKTAS